MMRCPKCGERFNPKVGQAEGEWSDIIKLLPAFGRHGRLVFEYTELFSLHPLTEKGKKIYRILAGLAAIFQEEKFLFDRKEYRISRAGIVEALTVVCNKQFQSPLENHHYLMKVMIGISDRERKAVRDEDDKRQREREAGGRRSEVRDQEEGPIVTAEEYKRRMGIESLAEWVGKKI